MNLSTNQELLDSDLNKLPEESTSSPAMHRNYILNDSSIFFKGLIGMVLCLAPAAIIGLILVKISLEQSKEAMIEYRKTPEQFRVSSINMVKRGRIFAYIGLGFFILEIIALVTYMSLI